MTAEAAKTVLVTGSTDGLGREALAMEQAYDREARRRLGDIAARLVSGVKLATGG